jgi:hypothetical protein
VPWIVCRDREGAGAEDHVCHLRRAKSTDRIGGTVCFDGEGVVLHVMGVQIVRTPQPVDNQQGDPLRTRSRVRTSVWDLCRGHPLVGLGGARQRPRGRFVDVVRSVSTERSTVLRLRDRR